MPFRCAERLRAGLMAWLVQSLTSTGCDKLAGKERQQPQSMQWDQQRLNRLDARPSCYASAKARIRTASKERQMGATARQCPASVQGSVLLICMGDSSSQYLCNGVLAPEEQCDGE